MIFCSGLLFRSLSWFLKLFNNIFLSLNFCIIFVLLNFQTFVKILIDFFWYEWFVVLLLLLFYWNDTLYVTAMFVCDCVSEFVYVCVLNEFVLKFACNFVHWSMPLALIFHWLCNYYYNFLVRSQKYLEIYTNVVILFNLFQSDIITQFNVIFPAFSSRALPHSVRVSHWTITKCNKTVLFFIHLKNTIRWMP